MWKNWESLKIDWNGGKSCVNKNWVKHENYNVKIKSWLVGLKVKFNEMNIDVSLASTLSKKTGK